MFSSPLLKAFNETHFNFYVNIDYKGSPFTIHYGRKLCFALEQELSRSIQHMFFLIHTHFGSQV